MKLQITRPYSEWARLEAIEAACNALVDAVTLRMGSGSSDTSVWAMFDAHRKASAALGSTADDYESLPTSAKTL